MTVAWWSAGEMWKAVSSRIVVARLKRAGKFGGRSARQSYRGPVFVMVVSV